MLTAEGGAWSTVNYLSLTRAGGSDVTWSKEHMGAPARTRYAARPKGGQWLTHKHAACSHVTGFTARNDAFLVAAVSVWQNVFRPNTPVMADQVLKTKYSSFYFLPLYPSSFDFFSFPFFVCFCFVFWVVFVLVMVTWLMNNELDCYLHIDEFCFALIWPL